jgi:sulfate adenylyltransferase subunit 1 (EFTu-like GTPase family)
VTELKHRVDVVTLAQFTAKATNLNDTRICKSRPASFGAYRDNRTTGAFILIDHDTNETVAAGPP